MLIHLLREISAISLWYTKSCCVDWEPLTLISNRICWYLDALNNILFSSISAIILILLFQFLKPQTDRPSINCCDFSVCFLRPDPLLVAAESLGSGGAKFKIRETTANYVVQESNFGAHCAHDPLDEIKKYFTWWHSYP